MPAQAGIQSCPADWIPASAGMTTDLGVRLAIAYSTTLGTVK